jgi:hypothetical protein
LTETNTEANRVIVCGVFKAYLSQCEHLSHFTSSPQLWPADSDRLPGCCTALSDCAVERSSQSLSCTSFPPAGSWVCCRHTSYQLISDESSNTRAGSRLTTPHSPAVCIFHITKAQTNRTALQQAQSLRCAPSLAWCYRFHTELSEPCVTEQQNQRRVASPKI